jgi:long-chain fatty acid transport protein
MVMVGDRIDMGLEWFKPNRSSTIGGAAGGAVNPGYFDGNGRQNFFIPQFGYNKMVNGNTSLGVSVFGNGGMNTAYNSNPFRGSSGVSGINLAQLFISPTWSMKLNPQNSIGVSLNIAYQMFSATGIQSFGGVGTSSTNGVGFNNPGTDTSTGLGLRLGWIGQVSPAVTLGATYQTKTKMSKFSKYSGLFADQGELDVPANYGVGIAVKANSATTVAFDVERIEYSGVPAIGNPMPNGLLLGASNGPGFGWKSINAYKLGFNYAMDSKLTLRAGVDHCDQPIQSSQVMFPILAPGVTQNHLSLGATWTMADKSEVTVGYVHSFKNSVSGNAPASYGGNPITLTMDQDAIGISYGW